ncbi:MAG: DUF3501 family protein [Candidatus Marinimicrobia bacterium]|nr:DUF3501 family protein [Candidatus Neomarinimicrobiota bacterium]MDG1847043.1 DUF3501 family protein [Candidatus Neomarinimicrobiota bacterium]
MNTMIDKSDLLNIIDYEKQRDNYRKELISYKKNRRFKLGPNILITFENTKTMKFQIQEMMRAERMVHDSQIEEEIDVYNPLIPRGNELSATLFIEITDPEKIRPVLDSFIGLTEGVNVYFELNGEKVAAVFEEGREKEDNISSVHYIRFPFTSAQKNKFANDSNAISINIDYNSYTHSIELSQEMIESLSNDFSN